MNQFKDHFLGKVKLDFTRATTCQKCLRTGDIENVGRTAYHHTFFEMLGNFSFGDYFKREAIRWAWELLTDKKWFGLDPQRLSPTVYLDDDEAADIWHKDIGLPTNRIERMGEDDDFWSASAPSKGPGEVCSIKYDPADDNGRRLRRIADHVRACTFAVHENVLPGPNREKYVIRRLLRRAVLDGYQMGQRDPFLFQLVPVVADLMKGPYPELNDTIERVQKGIKSEETTFFATVGAGLHRINKMFDEMRAAGRVVVHGPDAAHLYTTYGVPPEMVESMAAELNLAFDWDGYRKAMEEHGKTSGPTDTTLFKTGPI